MTFHPHIHLNAASTRLRPWGRALLLASLALASACGGDSDPGPAHGTPGPRPVAHFEALAVPEGHQVLAVAGLSRDGRIAVGTLVQPDGETRAWRWLSDGTGSALDLLPNGSYSTATGVSADGRVVVGGGNDVPRVAGSAAARAPSEAAWRWTPETGTQALPKVLTLLCAASGVSADGATVVGDCGFPFQWTAAAGSERLLIGGYETGVLDAISADASTIVGIYRGSGPKFIVFFRDGARASLPCSPPASTFVRFAALSSDGLVLLGTYTATDTRNHAVLCSADGGWQDLGSGTTSTIDLVASGLAGEGTQAIATGTTAAGWTVAMLWRPAKGWMRLDDVLHQEYDAALAGWKLETAAAISSDGRTVAGLGFDPEGRRAAWRVTMAPGR